jgi:hypothetical protein
MTTSVDTTSGPKNNRGTLPVKILVWSAVVLFLVAFVLVPRGITVFWSLYLLFFGPVIVVDLAAIVGFVVCVSMRRRISLAYLLISLAVMVGVWYVTWFELRLRWYEIGL